MARADLLILADRMERDLRPSDYAQDRASFCVIGWSLKLGVRKNVSTREFFELDDDEAGYLFVGTPNRDVTLAGTIAALREVAGRTP